MDDFEVRHSTIDTDGGRRLRGTAIVYNVLSKDLGGFKEIIKPEAVTRTLKNADEIYALFNHDAGKVLGNTRAGTLLLRTTHRGLGVDIDPPSWARDIVESVERGDIRGMSFRFRTKPEWVEWDFMANPPTRTIHDMEFSEISIVAMPAYKGTDVQVAKRSLEAALAEVHRARDPRWLRLKLAR